MDRPLPTDTDPQVWLAYFEASVQDPATWEESALALRDSAELLDRAYVDAYDAWSQAWDHWEQVSEHPIAEEPQPPRVGIYNAALMLRGFSIENLAKALIVKRNTASVRPGQLPVWPVDGPQQHDLWALIQAAGVSLDEHEQEFVQLLAGTVLWGGRYPTPTRYERLIPTGEPERIWLHSQMMVEFRERYRQLFAKLHDPLKSP